MVVLISVDYKILKFILKHGEVSKEEILEKFSDKKFATEYRLSLLEEQEYNKYLGADENRSYILETKKESGVDMFDIPKYEHTGSYYLTELGKKALYDYVIIKREQRNERTITLLLSGALSLIVSLAVSVISYRYFK